MSKTLQKLFLIYAAVLVVCLIALSSLIPNLSVSHYVIFLSGVMIAMLLSFITAYFFIHPIREMRETTERMAKGDFSRRVSIKSQGELSDLAENLNKMSADFQSKTKEITEDKNELNVILSSMVEGVIVIDKNEKIVLLGPVVSSMLDLRSRDAVGRPFWEMIRNEEINSSLSKAMAKKQAIKKELSIYFPEESVFSMQISPYFNEQGELSGIVAVFHDITELKRLERLRSEFVANVSHELKTPLTSIKGYVETLQGEDLDGKKTAKRFLEIIQKQTEHLEHLVNDLLSLSSLESKESKMNLEPVSLQGVIDAVVNFHKLQSDKKRQNISLIFPRDLPPALVDRAKIDEVFSNLLDNAIKFTPEGGSVVIRAKEENGNVRIDIEDTGIGIPVEHLPRIFERFYRVDKSRSRELGGTGLGLSIVKHIVQAHNGKVSVESTPHQGSRFSVFLPKS